jgi:hypothetical protein
MTNEIKTKTMVGKSKELWHHIVAARSSRRVEEGVDKVISLPARHVVILSHPERLVNGHVRNAKQSSTHTKLTFT